MGNVLQFDSKAALERRVIDNARLWRALEKKVEASVTGELYFENKRAVIETEHELRLAVDALLKADPAVFEPENNVLEDKEEPDGATS